jgi:hypothetical protein
MDEHKNVKNDESFRGHWLTIGLLSGFFLGPTIEHTLSKYFLSLLEKTMWDDVCYKIH